MSDKIPDFQTIMLPLLRLLADGQSHSLGDVTTQLSHQFALTEEDLRVKVPSGQQPMFKNRITWATSHLKNAGLILSEQRGVYKITDQGRTVLKENIDRLTLSYLKKIDVYKKWQSSFAEAGETMEDSAIAQPKETPEEIIGEAVKSINTRIAGELLDILKSKSADSFEWFVLALLKEMGYAGAEDRNFEVVGKSGDNGIDGIIYQDKLGIERVYVQAKRWADTKIQSKEIRDFIGSLSLKGTNKGIFITTSDFTADALKTVEMNPQNRIILINGQQLAAYAIKYNVGVQVKAEHQVKEIDITFFEEL